MPANPNDPRILERLHRMNGEERVRLAAEWYEAGHAIMAAGIRDAHQDWSDADVHTEVRRRCRLTHEDDAMPWP